MPREFIHPLSTPNLPYSLTALNLSELLKIENGDIIDGKIKDELLRLITPESNIGRLNLSGCSNLTTLPSLPDSLKTLYLDGCTSLTTLTDRLPANLTTLDLS